MAEYVSVEHSIHYAANDYSGRIINFDELTPIFIGYKQNKPIESGKSNATSKRFCYVVHILFDGECSFTESGNVHEVKKGDVFIAKPHVPISYAFNGTNTSSYAWIGFYGNYAKKLDDCATVHHLTTDYFSQIVRLLSHSGPVYAEPVAEILFNLLTEIFTADKNSNLAEIRAFLDKNYMKPITIDALAKQFSYNRTYLSQLFKKQYGYSLKEYLTNKRLTEALKLILDGKNISDVSYLVGYNNPYNFSNSFKAKYGVSPNKYLKKDSVIKR